MLLRACMYESWARLLAGSLAMVAMMAIGLILTPDVARAYEVRISISGAGQVTETTPANLVGSNCFSPNTTPTGTIGKTCLAGTPDGDYGWGWDVDYVASPASGYSFVRWESDGSSRSPVICDRSNPPATTSTYTGTTCKFRTFQNLQTRAVFADLMSPPMPTISSTDPQSSYTNGAMRFFFNLSQSDPTFKQFQCKVTPVVQTSFQACSSGISFSPSADGTYTFEVRSVDHSGNISSLTGRTFIVDATRPSGTVSINGGAQSTNNTSVSLTLSATDPSPGRGVSSMRFSDDGQVWSDWEPYATTKSWTLLSGDGTKTVHAQYKDNAGNVSTTVQDTIRLDTIAPMVTGATPSGTAVERNTDVAATFSEKMERTTITRSSFKLFKVNPDGTTTQVANVTVTLSSDDLSATLNPFGTSSTLLAKNARYKAIVTTGAKDLAGNRLDQNSTLTRNQPKAWTFKTGST